MRTIFKICNNLVAKFRCILKNEYIGSIFEHTNKVELKSIHSDIVCNLYYIHFVFWLMHLWFKSSWRYIINHLCERDKQCIIFINVNLGFIITTPNTMADQYLHNYTSSRPEAVTKYIYFEYFLSNGFAYRTFSGKTL